MSADSWPTACLVSRYAFPATCARVRAVHMTLCYLHVCFPAARSGCKNERASLLLRVCFKAYFDALLRVTHCFISAL
ncbi:hypothetical protein NDU88_010370 [Pleurodeles waltl]|uniref:Uncharacterized protein n=1 Tax=Pleurodeles waltl TaxID=8319 RepID=A0AAV7QVH2_PLEWA|nr:hypothetical protein NDU88_010370 [Pleurodeles waltl]